MLNLILNTGPYMRKLTHKYTSVLLLCIVAAYGSEAVLHRADAQQATPAEAISVPDGFRVQLIHSVPKATQGSWVVLTTDPRGRLVAGDQRGRLYRVSTRIQNGRRIEVDVAPLDLNVGHAQGLLFAFNSLYVMVNDDKQSGLYRAAYDTNTDRFGAAERILSIDGSGEHGPHTILLSEDRRSLVICAGNHTRLPGLTASRVPRCWNEDQLLRRVWDPNGHATGKMAPGGWVCRVSPDGKECELLAIGFRNEYDCARNADGELFSFDADMEWDIGTPWYRPTRILHVTSGAEFGWRGGCYKWPDYAPDSLPAVLDVGPGSPTGITFGTNAKYPEKFQQALFACDWGGGMMHAIHLVPRGSSYVAESEPFVSANALPFTDVVINPVDGAMYFTTGGRGTQSGLYRVSYVEPLPSGDSDTHTTRHEETVDLRKELESLHAPDAAADRLEFAWNHLDHSDRHVRFAARTAIEHVDYRRWADRIEVEPASGKRLAALLALVRVAPQLSDSFKASLDRLNFATLSGLDQLAMLRICELAEARHPGSLKNNDRLIQKMDRCFPSKVANVDQQLSKLLAYWETEGVVDRCLALVESESSLSAKLHYLLVLQNSSGDWTKEELNRYLSACHACKKGSGGKSYGGYVDDMVKWIETRLSNELKIQLGEQLERARQEPAPLDPRVDRPFVKQWTLDELHQQVVSGTISSEKGNPVNGQRLFAEAHCANCHRVNQKGATVGPDLSTIAKRFNASDLLTAIIDPNRDIADQYESTIFETKDGKVIAGRVSDQSEHLLKIRTDMYNPGLLTIVERDKIETTRKSTVSPMPTNLLDSLSPPDIQDLLAFLLNAS